MDNLRKHVIALLAVSLTLGSCSQEEPTDEQKMRDFDFGVFEEKTIDVTLQNDFGEYIQAPIVLTDGPKVLGYGITDKNGEIHLPISWHAGMDLKVIVGNNDKVDVGNGNHPIALTYNAPKTPKTKTETIIDSDGDGVTDSLDIDPNDARFVSYSSASGRFMFEDIFPYKGDYDFNDVVVDYQIDGYLDTNNNVRKVIIHLLPKNDGAGLENAVRLSLTGLSKSDIENLYYESSFNEKPVLLSTGSNWEIFTDITGLTGYWRPEGYYRWVTYTSYYRDPYAALVDIHNNGNVVNTFIDTVIWREKVFEWAGYHVFERNSFDDENPKTSTISFELPAGYQMSNLTGSSFGIHLKNEENGIIRTKDQDPDYEDEDGMPFGIHVPQNVMWPGESKRIDSLYPKFTSWSTSNGTTNQNWWE